MHTPLPPACTLIKKRVALHSQKNGPIAYPPMPTQPPAEKGHKCCLRKREDHFDYRLVP